MDNQEKPGNKAQQDNRDPLVETDNQVKMDHQVIVVKMELTEHLECVEKLVSQANQVLTDHQAVKVAKVLMENLDSLVVAVLVVNKVKMEKREEKVRQVFPVYVDLPVHPVQIQMFQWIR